jgi:hypothetical protein
MRDSRRRRGWEVIGPGTVVIGPGTGQWQWRGLFEDLLAYQGDDWAGEVIGPWARQHPGVIAELHAIGAPGSHRARVTWRRGEHSALEGLYALGRVVDVLAAPYQRVNQDPALLSWINGRPWWTGRIPDHGTLPAFAGPVGAAPISEEKFHPFFHEITAVEPASDPYAPAELVAEVWPGYLAGGLLLARAGVIVRAGPAALDPEVAARSCLYWAWWRRSRTTADLSHGWGASSPVGHRLPPRLHRRWPTALQRRRVQAPAFCQRRRSERSRGPRAAAPPVQHPRRPGQAPLALAPHPHRTSAITTIRAPHRRPRLSAPDPPRGG